MMRASKRSLRLDVDISDSIEHESKTESIYLFELLLWLPSNGKYKKMPSSGSTCLVIHKELFYVNKKLSLNIYLAS